MIVSHVRRPLALLLCISITAVSAAGCGGHKKKLAHASQLQQFGSTKLQEGNYEGAVADLTQARRLDPKNAEIVQTLGLALWGKANLLKDPGLKDEARKTMIVSMDMKGDRVPGEWRNNLGALYVDMQLWSEAVVELEKAIKDPEYRTPERPLNNLAKASLEQRKCGEAEQYADRALRVQPRFCMALINKADASKCLKRNDDALGSYLKAIAECPEYPEPYLKAGTLSFEMKKKTEAKQMWTKAKELDPDGPFGREADKYLKTLGGK